MDRILHILMHRVLLSTPWRARIKRTRPQVRISNTFPPRSGWQEHLTRDMLIYNNCIQICKTRKTAHTHNQLIIFNYGYRPENGHISKDLQEDLCISCNYLKQFKVIPRGCPTQICHATEAKRYSSQAVKCTHRGHQRQAASCTQGIHRHLSIWTSRYPYTFHAHRGYTGICQSEQQIPLHFPCIQWKCKHLPIWTSEYRISCIPGWPEPIHNPCIEWIARHLLLLTAESKLHSHTSSMHTVDYQAFATLDCRI